jgi:TRAP-type mannitol/chloroaromatic compound transport system permease large subunit
MAQVIPPSLVLIVMADQLGRSVGDIYVGAAYPALLLTALYCVYIFGVTLVRPAALPALPVEARTLDGGVGSLAAAIVAAPTLYVLSYSFVFDGLRYETRLVWSALAAILIVYGFALANHHFRLGLLSRLAEQVVFVLIPPMALIFLVLGTIFLGIATPTEAGAMGATGALALAVAKRRMTWTTLRQALEATTKLSSFVMFILIGARVFGLTFYGVNGDIWIERLLLSLPGGEYGFLIFVTVIVFVLGCFLDFFEIAFILVPLLAPAAEILGIDLIWFGIILSLYLQASFLTPPFGFSLFFLRSVAPSEAWHDSVSGRTISGVRTLDIYRGVIPFVFLQFAVVALVIASPPIVTHYKVDDVTADPATVDIQLPPLGEIDNSLQLPDLGLPPPELGAPDRDGQRRSVPPEVTPDLLQPPRF